MTRGVWPGRQGWTQMFADHRVRRQWGLGGVALFLHGVADPVVTYLAVVVFEVGHETNPWLAGVFSEGPLAVIFVHLPLYLFVAGVVCGLTWLFAIASPTEARQLSVISLVGWIGLIGWGVMLVVQNVWVLVQAFT